MLRISKMADYGTVIMACLAGEHPRLMQSREIAVKTALTLTTVSKLLKKLQGAGLLKSARGVTGGYHLMQGPESITLGAIVTAIEGAAGMTECSDAALQHCPLESHCQVQSQWRTISDVVMGFLARIPLSDFAKGHLQAAKTINEEEGNLL